MATRQADHRDPADLDLLFVEYGRLVQADVLEVSILALESFVVDAFGDVYDRPAGDGEGVLEGVGVRAEQLDGHVERHRKGCLGGGCDGGISVRGWCRVG